MMKSFFKKLAFVMALAMVVSMAAPAATTASAAEEMKIGYQNGAVITELNLTEARSSEDLKPVGAPSNWKELGITWISSNPAVATVDNAGVVTAVSAGTAELMVTCGDYTATIPVNCFADAKAYDVTIGVDGERSITEKTLKVGEEFDFKFFGVMDYGRDKVNNAPRYFCEWDSTDTAVATVDKNGLVKAVAPGKAKITLIVWNLATGTKHNVTPTWVTVEAAEAPKAEVTLKQTTEKKVQLTFDSTEGLKAEDFALNCVYEEGMEIDWSIKKVSIEDKKVTIETYTEFTDGGNYVVRVKGNEEELFFTASVGDVVSVVPYVASVWSNEIWGYVYPGVVYAASEDRASVDSVVGISLYDANGVDVTGHYYGVDRYIPGVTYEIVGDNYNISLNNTTGDMVAYKAGEAVTILVTYRHYDNAGNEIVKEARTSFVTQPAPAYNVTEILEWSIVKDTATKIDWNNPVHKIAVEDDNDDADANLHCDYDLALLFRDNYGRTYSTHPLGVSAVSGRSNTFSINEERFAVENYSIRFETSNANKLLIDEYGTFTTYAEGKIPVIVSLHNNRDEYNNTFVRNLMAVPVEVLGERVVTTIQAGNVTLASDENEADTSVDWDFYGGGVWVMVFDQHWDAWKSNLDLSLTTSKAGVATSGDGYGNFAIGDGSGKVTYSAANKGVWVNLNGKLLKAAMGTDNTVRVTLQDNLRGGASTYKKVTFTITIKNPAKDANGNIITQAMKSLNGPDTDLAFWSSQWSAGKKINGTVAFVDLSNYVPVNYVNNVTFVASQGALNVNSGNAAVNDRFLVVKNPDGAIVGLAADDANGIGMTETTSGKYVFTMANINGDIMKYTKTGTYTVQVLKIRKFNGTTPEFGVEYSDTFSVKNTSSKATLREQKAIITDATDVFSLVEKVFTFNNGGEFYGIVNGDGSSKNLITKVAGRYNQVSNTVIIDYVKIKLPIYDDAWNFVGYYESKVTLNRAITVPAGFNANFNAN